MNTSLSGDLVWAVDAITNFITRGSLVQAFPLADRTNRKCDSISFFHGIDHNRNFSYDGVLYIKCNGFDSQFPNGPGQWNYVLKGSLFLELLFNWLNPPLFSQYILCSVWNWKNRSTESCHKHGTIPPARCNMQYECQNSSWGSRMSSAQVTT